MAVYKRGPVWWYRFNWNAELIRKSTRQSNKRVVNRSRPLTRRHSQRVKLESAKRGTFPQWLSLRIAISFRTSKAALPTNAAL